MSSLATESPEVTGIYTCPCGNTTRFTGIDLHGWGGPDACDGNPKCQAAEHCLCMTRLAQDFDVHSDGEIDYHAFTGGESDSEISCYDRIICRACGRTIWEEVPNA